jgi:hypothetical protein
MRASHAIALVTVILVGISVKLFFFPAAPAEAEARPGLDVSRMHVGKKLPVQKLHDMTFVFSHDD